MILDGDGRTKYQNFGKANSGFIVTPTLGPTQISNFIITTGNGDPAADPSSWALYGTNDPILSQNFSQGTAENWTFIDSGTLALPDARLEPGPRVDVDNMQFYLSYRMVFPSLKNATAPGVTSMQFADIQFYQSGPGGPATPTPEPGTVVLAVCGTIGIVAAAGTRHGRRR